MTFNLLADGLRRFLDESHVNVGRVFNRYTALAVTIAGLIVGAVDDCAGGPI